MKKAFTLIEMIISISIFSIMLLYLYQSVEYSRKKNQSLQSKFESYKNEEKLKILLYNDIFNQLDPQKDANVTIIDKNYDNLFLKTNNSIHDQITPFIAYTIVNETLFRLESINEIKLPINYDNINSYQIDQVQDQVKSFKIHKTKTDYLFYISTPNQNKIFEISLPYNKTQPKSDQNQSQDSNGTKQWQIKTNLSYY